MNKAKLENNKGKFNFEIGETVHFLESGRYNKGEIISRHEKQNEKTHLIKTTHTQTYWIFKEDLTYQHSTYLELFRTKKQVIDHVFNKKTND